MSETGMPDETLHVDAIVVGSGLCGGVAAKTLAEAGRKVCVLEAGPLFSEADLSAPPSTAVLPRIRGVLRGHWRYVMLPMYGPALAKMLGDARNWAYSFPSGRDYHWVRTRLVGGRGHLWRRFALRLSEEDFSAEGPEIGPRWPVSYDEVAPYYAEVEELLGLKGNPDGLAHLPDGHYVKGPDPLTAQEERFAEAIRARWPERAPIAGRVASYAPSVHGPGLAAALATGNCILKDNTVAVEVELDASGQRATGILALDQQRDSKVTIRGDVVVLAASALETVRLLLGSTSNQHPRGLGNSSGTLGRFLLDHTQNMLVGLMGDSGKGGAPFTEMRTGLYVPWFRQREQADVDYPNHWGIQCELSETAWYLNAFGEALPREYNRMTLRDDRQDGFGRPLPHIDFQYSEHEYAMHEDMQRVLEELVREAGLPRDQVGVPLRERFTNWYLGRKHRKLSAPGSAIHESGGARMGADPRHSVVNPNGRLWDVDNVVVGDAACFPRIGAQNPSLTAMALAVRACRLLP